MDVQEILNQLEREDMKLPREALREAVDCRDEIVPLLLKVIEAVKDRPLEFNERLEYMAHIYAMFLLALFREKRAYSPIVDFFLITGELPCDLTGDVVTEDLPRILASVSCGDDRLIKGLVENSNAHEYVRGAALKSLVTLVVWGEKSRDEVMRYIQHLFRGGLERDFSHIWNSLAARATDLCPEEVIEDIRKAYKDDLIESFYIDLGTIEKALATGKEESMKRLDRNVHHSRIEDPVKELEWWACFNPKEALPFTGREAVAGLRKMRDEEKRKKKKQEKVRRRTERRKRKKRKRKKDKGCF